MEGKTWRKECQRKYKGIPRVVSRRTAQQVIKVLAAGRTGQQYTYQYVAIE